MDIYTVSLFGHRKIENVIVIEKRLEQIIYEIIKTNEYVDFLIGRNGEFDLMAASVIRRVNRRLGFGNSNLILVLPYINAEYRDNREEYLDYYDEVEVCYESSISHYKAAIQVRNRQMVDRSELIICGIQHICGGAYATVRYALKQGKDIISLDDTFLIKKTCTL